MEAENGYEYHIYYKKIISIIKQLLHFINQVFGQKTCGFCTFYWNIPYQCGDLATYLHDFNRNCIDVISVVLKSHFFQKWLQSNIISSGQRNSGKMWNNTAFTGMSRCFPCGNALESSLVISESSSNSSTINCHLFHCFSCWMLCAELFINSLWCEWS